VVQRTQRHPAHPDAVIAVDLGVKNLAVLSTGAVLPNPRHLDAALGRLRRISRTLSRRAGPDRRTRQTASRRWRRANQRRARLHARVANLRRESIHQFTTALARTYGTVVVEDLNVAGMLANRRLARRIADAGFGEIRRQLAYKTTWNGGRLIVVDRWYPSSKTCSGCGVVKAKLALSERTYHCHNCGLSLDRDLNAARNLAAHPAASVVPEWPGDDKPGRGADHKTRPVGQAAVKRQPGTAHADKTGTAPPQDGTANHEAAPTHAS
jgi:IS605 OrfB family transposase